MERNPVRIIKINNLSSFICVVVVDFDFEGNINP
jgi:hypothetical protein